MQETDLIKEVYAEKYKIDFSNWKDWIYHPRHPIGHIFRQHNESVTIRAFNSLGIDVCKKKILDVGCGYGNWLRMFAEWGAQPNYLYGIDMLDWRLSFAKQRSPLVNYGLGNCEGLPFKEESFDIVMQSTVFSSIRDSDMRQNVAQEMMRCMKPGGYLLWIDLRPIDSNDLIGFSEQDIKILFKELTMVYKQMIHPLYFRWLSAKSAGLCHLLYGVTKVKCESYLIVLRKSEGYL